MAEAFKITMQCVQSIPEYNGTDSSQLSEFINAVEVLQPMFEALQDQYKPVLFRIIKNKCVGKTRDAICCSQNGVETWVQLKSLLKDQFGEKKTVIELMDSLKTLQLNGTIEGFYNKIKKIVVKINNRRITHEETIFTPEEITRAALVVFRNHLPEPTKTMIFARNPTDLDSAFKIILEARHQNYTQQGPTQNNLYNNRNSGENRGVYNNQNNDYNRTQYNNRNNYNNQNNNQNNNRNNNNNRNENKNYNRNYNNNYNRNNNINNNYNNNNRYNNNNNNNSGNYRRSTNNSGNFERNGFNNPNNQNVQHNGIQPMNPSVQSRRSNVPEPMEIGQVNSNFQQGGSNNFLI